MSFFASEYLAKHVFSSSVNKNVMAYKHKGSKQPAHYMVLSLSTFGLYINGYAPKEKKSKQTAKQMHP